MTASDYSQLSLIPVYDSDECDILCDFYIPALSSSILYQRSAGFFSSGSLMLLSSGLSVFLQNQGKIQMIVGRDISDEDFHAIKTGCRERDSALNRMREEMESWVINADGEELARCRIATLVELIRIGRLELKIAFRRRGLFHEKVGILTDVLGQHLVFQGSMNETHNALNSDYNFESIDVYRGWIEANKRRIEIHREKFERLWRNEARNTITLDLPEIIESGFISLASGRSPLTLDREIELWEKFRGKRSLPEMTEVEKIREPNVPMIPDQLGDRPYELKEHQLRAIEAWNLNNESGIFELCTGSGKTIAAIHAAVKKYQSDSVKCPFLLVIAVPFINLAEQWIDVLAEYNISPIQCWGSAGKWRHRLQPAWMSLCNSSRKFLCLVVVNATLRRPEFQSVCEKFARAGHVKKMIIGDEVHNHESEKTFSLLPTGFDYHLGLSATIENTENIANYYGDSIAQYDISRAISENVLCPYYYYPVAVSLTFEESQEYLKVERNIARALAAKNPPVSKEVLGALYRKRNNISGNAQKKLEFLGDLARTLPKGNGERYLVYCSSRINPGEEESSDEDVYLDISQINRVSEIMYRHDFRTSQYTAQRGNAERKRMMTCFTSKHLDALVAIRCLDEGIDIPSIDCAILMASTGNRKQFIQRRGRVLRRSPGKEFATIYDTVLFHHSEINGGRILPSEKKRFEEFAKDAKNGDSLRLDNLVLPDRRPA